MTILTDTEIDDVCTNILSNVSTYEPHLFAMFQTMYNLGCRETETVTLSRWTPSGFHLFDLQTMKRGGIRVISYDVLPALFISTVLNPPSRGFLYSARNLRDVFNKFSPYRNIFCKDKEIACHLFRHNKMKQLFNEGNDYNQIANYFAVSDAFVAQYYVTSVIEVP
ncbi:MAG: hypothetical protein ABI855_05285 [Bacteroidota bacterium]